MYDKITRACVRSLAMIGHNRRLARHDVVAMIDDACEIGRDQRQDAGLAAASADDELRIPRRLRRRLAAARVVPIERQMLLATSAGPTRPPGRPARAPRRRVEHAAEQVRIARAPR